MDPDGFIEGPLDLQIQCNGVSANFLDVTVTLRDRSITYQHYDKRDDIPASINTRPFPDIYAFLSEPCKYAVFTSALHRINVSSSYRSAFVRRAISIKYGSRIIRSGYSSDKSLAERELSVNMTRQKENWG